jgi:hypothetical protein
MTNINLALSTKNSSSALPSYSKAKTNPLPSLSRTATKSLQSLDHPSSSSLHSTLSKKSSSTTSFHHGLANHHQQHQHATIMTPEIVESGSTQKRTSKKEPIENFLKRVTHVSLVGKDVGSIGSLNLCRNLTGSFFISFSYMYICI